MQFRRWAVGFVLGLTSIGAVARGESPAATQAATTQAATTQAAVDTTQPAPTLADVLAVSDRASNQLRDVDARLSADPITQSVDDQIGLYTRDISNRIEETDRLLAPGTSLETLRPQEADYEQFQKQIKSWQDDLGHRRDDLNAIKKELTTLDASVNDAIKNAGTIDANSDVRSDLLSLSSQIASRQNRVKNETARIDDLASRLHQPARRVGDELNKVRAAIGQAWDRMLDQDSDPLWRAILSRATSQQLSEAGRNTFRAQWQTVSAYVQLKRANFLLHLAVMATRAAGRIWMRRRMRAYVANDPSVERATVILQMPIAVALVVTVIFSAWVYPQAPRLFWAIFGAAALLPTIYVLRRLVEKELIPLFYALAVWCVLNLLISITASLPILARCMFVLQMVGGAAFFIWFLRSIRHEQGTQDRILWRVTKVGARVAIMITSVAAVANIFGYVNLSRLLGAAIFTSAYLGVLLDATVRVVDAILLAVSHLYPLDTLGMMRRHRELLLRRTHYVIAFAALLMWTYFTLWSVSLWSPLTSHVHAILDQPWTSVQFPNITLGKILHFAVVVAAAFMVSRFINFLLDEDVYPRVQLARGVPYAISTLLRYVILLLGFIAAISSLGYEATQLTILASAFTLGIGFGLQNIVNNFVSGLILLFERPVQVGDVIQVDDMTGVVSRIGIRASVIRTSAAAEIIVPNGNLISNKVINWTLSNRQRGVELSISIASGPDPRHVIDLLLGVAKSNPLVAPSPVPQAYFVDFIGGGMKFELRAWTNRYEDWTRLRSDLAIAITAMVAKENLTLK
ncbi:MAG: mechanosensitive ion channel domain-containing protein [Tepidisphaeraceae bacterium]